MNQESKNQCLQYQTKVTCSVNTLTVLQLIGANRMKQFSLYMHIKNSYSMWHIYSQILLYLYFKAKRMITTIKTKY